MCRLMRSCCGPAVSTTRMDRGGFGRAVLHQLEAPLSVTRPIHGAEALMFVIFGWLKDAREVGPGLDCYCYTCQRARPWEHWRVTEWVTFFDIRTIPFLWRNHVVCAGCRQAIQLDGQQSRKLQHKAQWPSLVHFLEQHQLAKKSELQRNFLLSQRAERERNVSPSP